MDNRRFLIAVVLAFAVFWIYVSYFGPPPPPAEPAPEAVRQQAEETPKRTAPVVATRIKRAAAGRDIEIETDVARVVLSTAGGTVKRWELKKYREADKQEVGLMVTLQRLWSGQAMSQPKKDLGQVQLLPVYDKLVASDALTFPLTLVPLEKELAGLGGVEYRASADRLVTTEERPDQSVTLTYAGPAGILVEKKLTFHHGSYLVDIEVTTKGLEGYRISLGTDFGLTDKISSDAAGRVGLAAMLDGKLLRNTIEDVSGEVQHAGVVAWAGQEDKYFTATLRTGAQAIVAARRSAAPKEIGDLLTTDLTVKEQTGSRTFALYAGPKIYSVLAAHGAGMERLVDYGWFTILAKPMFWMLQQFYALFKNYGVAIVLLTIVVRIILYYPSLKSATAMEEMKALQPQLTAIREKYRKDPQRMNQEIMKLYKEHKVNPMGGCLPMLLQLPFFVALYNVLSVSIELRQAPFIPAWINDLSVHDPYYVLPILMGVSMVATMRMSATSMDPQQEKIMMFMNVAFIFLFAWLPAGLLLYITLSNVLSIGQQYLVRRQIASANR